MLSWETSVSPIVDQLEDEEDLWEGADDFEEDDEKDFDDEDDELEAEYEEYEEEFAYDDQPKHGRRPAEWD
jgi:hypothetical protein